MTGKPLHIASMDEMASDILYQNKSESMPQLQSVAILLYFHLYVAIQTKSSMRNSSAIDPVTTENM